MLPEVKQKLDLLPWDEKDIDLSVFFDDPVSAKTEWDLMDKPGENFSFRRLLTHNDQMSLQPIPRAWIYAFVMELMGLVFLLVTYQTIVVTGQRTFSAILLSAIFGVVGLLVVIVGIKLILDIKTTIAFDRQKGSYTRGGVTVGGIHAIQAIDFAGECQMILVMNDAGRHIIISDNDTPKVCSAATELATFLGIPFWDVTGVLEAWEDKARSFDNLIDNVEGMIREEKEIIDSLPNVEIVDGMFTEDDPGTQSGEMPRQSD